MNDPKKNNDDLNTELANEAQLTLSDDDLKMLAEGELAEVTGGSIPENMVGV